MWTHEYMTGNSHDVKNGIYKQTQKNSLSSERERGRGRWKEEKGWGRGDEEDEKMM